ncbi:uncharacterized protein LOC111637336 [Centruroides sculpturatus]|uniref:uncharacterized protein LOC111637336 n=1 Tax=Centruroides sculpturatus TaxID=218467 RepID=UPI000C6E4117|nr:uncharacterized protein LOC111637336 [Centruroides sculpturatus]
MLNFRMALEKKLPILRTDFNILDKEFDSNREKFENEIKKMEDEMNRFRIQIASREDEIFGGKHDTKEKGATSGQPIDDTTDEIQRMDNRTWLDAMNSPSAHPGRLLKLKFDLHEYKLEEITVKTVYNKLQVGLISIIHCIYKLFMIRTELCTLC